MSGYTERNAPEVMHDFFDGQGQLVSSAEQVDQQLTPFFQLVASTMQLAVYVKQTGQASPDEQKAWSSYMHQWNTEAQGPASENFMTSMRAHRSEGFSKLRHLIGNHDNDSTDFAVHCPSTLPYDVMPSQADYYADQIMARWTSKDWLIEGRINATTDH